MIEYTTKYDVRKTMYQKFAESVAKTPALPVCWQTVCARATG